MNNNDLLTINIIGIEIINTLRKIKAFKCSDSWNSKKNVIRFVTPQIEKIFKPRRNLLGHWNNGKRVFYEIENNIDKLVLRCSVDYNNLNSAQIKSFAKIVNHFEVYYEEDICVVSKWCLTKNELNTKIEKLINDFEIELSKCIKEEIEEIDEGALTEGDLIRFLSTKYERNPKARKACLDYYGYKCKICNFDFASKYGNNFKNIIEVHHIVPLNSIKESYVVNPVKDLIPICPNCHTIIHSKKDGVYSPDEVKELIEKTNKIIKEASVVK